MKTSHIHLVGLVSLLILTTVIACPPVTKAEEYPNSAVTLINQFPVGGGADIALRAIATDLEKILKQPVLVESKAGAAGIIAGEYVARAKPDGYIIGGFHSTACVPEVYNDLRPASYSSQDLQPVARYFVALSGLWSKKDAPWKNLGEFITYVKNNPRKVKWGHQGVGHRFHILGVALAKAHNLEMIAVPFKGAGPLITAVLGGHVDVGIGGVAGVLGHVQSGKMLVLAVDGDERAWCMPDIPTFRELGYDPGLPPYYFAFFVPRDTPRDRVKKIHDAVKEVIEAATFREKARKLCLDLSYGSASDVMNDIKRDKESISKLLVDILKDKD